MRRYVAWVQIDNEGYRVAPEPNRDPVTVFEREPGPIRTGLLDLRGNQIMRTESVEPIGFLKFEAR